MISLIVSNVVKKKVWNLENKSFHYYASTQQWLHFILLNDLHKHRNMDHYWKSISVWKTHVSNAHTNVNGYNCARKSKWTAFFYFAGLNKKAEIFHVIAIGKCDVDVTRLFSGLKTYMCALVGVSVGNTNLIVSWWIYNIKVKR